MHSETNVLLRELITKCSPVQNHSMSTMYPGQLVDSQSHLRPPVFTALHTQPRQLPLPPPSSAIYSTRTVEPQQSQAQPQQETQQQMPIPYPVRVTHTAPGRSRTTAPSLTKASSSSEPVVIIDGEESEEENLLEPKINTVSATVEELSIMDINLSDDDFFNRVVSSDFNCGF